MKQRGLKIVYLSTVLLLSGCNADLNTLFKQDAVQAPVKWQDIETTIPVNENWLASFNIKDVNEFVQDALQNNIELKELFYNIEIAKQRVIQANVPDLPSLDFTLNQQRSNSTSDANPRNTANVGLDLQYEVDVWGKFDDQQKEAVYNLLNAEATYKQAKQQLVSDVFLAWLDVVEAKKRLDLFERRVENAKNNQIIIESGYEKGLNEALDVYLVRNEVNAEQATVQNQKSSIVLAIRRLERLLGQYPSGILNFEGEIPNLTTPIEAGLPQDLIARKPSLAASWNTLLSRNAALAFAHKDRLPSLSLATSLQDSARLVTNLFNGDPLVWSLLGSVTSPIFDAGNLKAEEAVAREELRQAEFQYLSDIYIAFLDVENAITQEGSLKDQLVTTQQAVQNAAIAAELSFEQYQRGLVEYTTVLEAQNRFYDAELNLIEIQADLVSNRVELHLALGGDFTSSAQVEGSL
mgnify:CR=1 FL=1